MNALIICSVAIAFFFAGAIFFLCTTERTVPGYLPIEIINNFSEMVRENSRLNDSITYLNVALESSRREVGRLQEILRKGIGVSDD